MNTIIAAAAPLLTAEDLLRMPYDGLRHELVRGELRTMTPAGSEHGLIAWRLAGIIFNYLADRDIGVAFGAETGFRLSAGGEPDTVRAPDVSFVRRERIPPSGIPEGYWPGAPDLAVEVVSPGDRYTEVDAKVADWLRAGTALVWVVNPRRRTVTVHTADAARTLPADGELTGADVLPGFACPVAALFQ